MSLHAGRVAADVRLHLGEDLVRRLRLDQADVALGERLVRQDRLRAGAAVAAVQAVDREGRPGRQALDRSRARAAHRSSVRSRLRLIRVEIDRQRRERLLLQRASAASTLS